MKLMELKGLYVTLKDRGVFKGIRGEYLPMDCLTDNLEGLIDIALEADRLNQMDLQGTVHHDYTQLRKLLGRFED